MGGNAFPDGERKSAAEYHRIAHVVRDLIEPVFAGTRCLLKAYRTKETFGDADLVVEDFGLDWRPHSAGDGSQMPRWFRDVLDLMPAKTPYYQNKPTYGFLYEGLQIDLIVTSTEDLRSSVSYYDWNDLGNLMGTPMRGTGFRYGWRGLEYPVYGTPTQLLGTVNVTRDQFAIAEFLGYLAEPLCEGFDTVDDIYRYVSSCKFFRREAYALTSLTSKQRVRDEKRTTYQGFLTWLEQNPQIEDGVVLTPDRWYARVGAWVPDFYERVATIREDYAYTTRVADAWNGQVAARLTGLTGPTLGQFVRYCRALPQFSPQSIANAGPHEIARRARVAHTLWSRQQA